MHFDILVFSHLKWNSVKQRPHHIVNRLSETYSVLFVEEPDPPADGFARNCYRLENIAPNITVFTPLLKWDGWKIMCQQYVRLLKEYVRAFDETLFWFYSPFYVHILGDLRPSFIVYDCMDELSAFKNASSNLPAYEKQLMERADLVFTGGKSLYRAKRALHPDVYCFPSSVESDHFNAACCKHTAIPQDLAALRSPVIGYYGVIDERIDFDLLANVAAMMTSASFVMIGLFAKIEKEDTATAANIHYLGRREYAVLPHYLKGFDVAMMPFAIGPATRFISPTKTLEYLAARKPVVSTPVPDVVEDYSAVVAIAGDPETFAALLQRHLSEPKGARTERERLQQLVVNSTSWDKTVAQMRALIAKKQMDQGIAPSMPGDI